MAKNFMQAILVGQMGHMSHISHMDLTNMNYLSFMTYLTFMTCYFTNPSAILTASLIIANPSSTCSLLIQSGGAMKI